MVLSVKEWPTVKSLYTLSSFSSSIISEGTNPGGRATALKMWIFRSLLAICGPSVVEWDCRSSINASDLDGAAWMVSLVLFSDRLLLCSVVFTFIFSLGKLPSKPLPNTGTFALDEFKLPPSANDGRFAIAPELLFLSVDISLSGQRSVS